MVTPSGSTVKYHGVLGLVVQQYYLNCTMVQLHYGTIEVVLLYNQPQNTTVLNWYHGTTSGCTMLQLWLYHGLFVVAPWY